MNAMTHDQPTDPLVARMRPFGTTIFAEMSALAVRTGSVNLGQGFPDTDGPPEMLDAAVRALRGGQNQYPPGPGMADLRAASRRTPTAILGSDLRPRRRSDHHRRGHRGDRRRDPRPL